MLKCWFPLEWNPRRRLRDQLRIHVSKGMHPRRIALAIAVGATLGMLPLLWGTWVLCALCAGCLRLNQLLVQLAHAMVYPLHLVLFIPYLKIAERIYADDLLPAGAALVLHQLQHSPGLFFKQFCLLNLQAASVWLMTAPLVLGAVFGMVLKSLKFMRVNRRTIV